MRIVFTRPLWRLNGRTVIPSLGTLLVSAVMPACYFRMRIAFGSRFIV
jgi:hypothetical protein